MKKEIGSVVFYKLREKLVPKEKARFHRELSGYLDKSFYGHFHYRRKGLLSKIPHLSPVRAALITRKKYVPILLKFLSPSASVLKWDIILSEEDIKKMEGK
ncbi:MAG: hypothetical protein V3T89_03030 [bacterium]